MTIYLASKSPRRKELLSQMGVSFESLHVDIPEEVLPNESVEAYSTRITREKLLVAWNKLKIEKCVERPILCADTEVVFNHHILGKPRDYQDAFLMLKSYSGFSHEVITSVGIRYRSFEKIVLNTTKVYFATIPEDEIHKYLKTGDYKDKAGGYGIQSYIGQFIYKIEGCFYSVMGLPLSTVRELLLECNNARNSDAA